VVNVPVELTATMRCITAITCPLTYASKTMTSHSSGVLSTADTVTAKSPVLKAGAIDPLSTGVAETPAHCGMTTRAMSTSAKRSLPKRERIAV
jgi:hypothetical protein